jgi:hypothetical protein
MKAAIIRGLLDTEKNPDVRELLRLHLEVALKECGHPRDHSDYNGDHAPPAKWCPDCRMWV